MAIPANMDLAAEQESGAFISAQSKEADFEAQCKGVVLKTTANVHIAFDRPANTSDFLLASTDLVVHFPVQFTSVSAIGDSGSGTLYIIGLR